MPVTAEVTLLSFETAVQQTGHRAIARLGLRHFTIYSDYSSVRRGS